MTRRSGQAATGWAARLVGAVVRGVAAVAMLATATSAAAQSGDRLGGGYVGIDQAEGWRLLLAPVEVEGAPAFDGRFIDETGASTGFTAVPVGPDAEAQVQFADAMAFFRLSPRPVGLMLSWVPMDQDGRLAVEASAVFPFVRDDVAIPSAPERIAPPPESETASFSAVAFLRSYEFWTPEETGRAYASMTGRSKALIKLYASVHTDILWKLCQSRSTPPGLTEALDGQAVDCPALLGAMADIQRRGLFSAYKSDLAPEQAALIDAMRCAMGVYRPQEDCVAISRVTSERALSLETAASILDRY